MVIKYKIKKVTLKLLKSQFITFYPHLKHKKLQIIKPNAYIGYAYDNRKIIATLIFSELIDLPFIWQLERISVIGGYLRKCVGSNLLRLVEEKIIRENGKKILVFVSKTNKIAQKFYKKNKYKKEAKIKNLKMGKEDMFIYTKEILQ